ncbi:MAG: LysM peptidoglycan-binding domain-containing protein [Opitutales bacterium]
MKVSKIFGCVLGLHACLIAVLIVQPGCQSTQPPTQTYRQDGGSSSANEERSVRSFGSRATVPGASRTLDGLIPAARLGEGAELDPAFNAGFEDERYAPRGEFSEFDGIEPLEPLRADSAPTVDVDGASFETYTVKKGDSLWAISKRYDVSLKELYEANGLNKNSVLRVGQQIEIPVEGSTATVDTVEPERSQPTRMDQDTTDYTVRRGDTLSKIANQYDTTVGAIKAANGKGSDMIRVGETLVIPVGENAPATSEPSESSSDSASEEPAPSSGASGSGTHVVRSGEYPATIARKYGMTTSELLAANGITDPRKLRVGQRLKVSGSGSASNVDSRAETAASPRSRDRSDRTQASPDGPDGPVQIRVIEADPLVEGELEPIAPESPSQEQESSQELEPSQEDDPFNDAVEIPVIRMEE